MDGKLFVDFEAYAVYRSQLEHHITDSQTRHDHACQTFEHHIGGHLAQLPTIRGPMLELVSLLRQRHEQTRQFLTDTWLPMLTQIVEEARADQATFIKDNETL